MCCPVSPGGSDQCPLYGRFIFVGGTSPIGRSTHFSESKSRELISVIPFSGGSVVTYQRTNTSGASGESCQRAKVVYGLLAQST